MNIKSLWNNSTLFVASVEDTDIVLSPTRTSKHLPSIKYKTISLLSCRRLFTTKCATRDPEHRPISLWEYLLIPLKGKTQQG